MGENTAGMARPTRLPRGGTPVTCISSITTCWWPIGRPVTAAAAWKTSSTTHPCRSATCRHDRLKITHEQAGHAYASTTAIYTGVSDEYRNRLLERSLRQR